MPEWDRHNMREFLRLAATNVDAAAQYIRNWPEWLVRGNGRESLLHSLAIEDQYHAVEALIRAGADLSDPIDWHCTPVWSVASLGYLELLALLLRSGCSPSTVEEGNERSAVQVAIEHGHAECVRLLLSAGADVEQGRDLEGGRPLHTAAQCDQIEIAQMLLDVGADLHSVDDFDDNTALHYAARRGFVAVTTLLLERGARPTARNADGKTPAELAWAAGHYEVFALLLR